MEPAVASTRVPVDATVTLAVDLVTPPDPISQIGLALPGLILYEASILMVRRIEKNREKREAEEAAAS